MNAYYKPRWIERFERNVEQRWYDRWDRQARERVDRHFWAVGIDPVQARRKQARP